MDDNVKQYCAGCGNVRTSKACSQCGSWEFVDGGGLDLLRSVGRIDSDLVMIGTSPQREAQAHNKYGSTITQYVGGNYYNASQVRAILRRQGYNV